jgi:uncharacterized membrane protein YbhN (UPF0104 family)
MKHPREHWQTWLKVLLGLALLFFALRAGFRPDTLTKALAGINLFWVFAALGLVVLGTAGKALRWSLLLTGVPPAPGPSQTWGPLLTGQAFNMLAWARMGDLVRIWLLASQTRAAMPAVATTLVIEDVFDLVTYGSLALFLSADLAAIPTAVGRVPAIIGVALLGAAVLGLLVYRGDALARLVAATWQRLHLPAGGRVAGWLDSAVAALVPLKQGRRFWPILLLTVVIWLASWFTNVWLFSAFDLNLPPAAGLLVLVLIIVGVSPGLMPTNIGPFYFLTVLALQQYAVDPVVALAYAAVLHAMVTGVPVLGAAIHLADQWRRSGQRPRLTPPFTPSNP